MQPIPNIIVYMDMESFKDYYLEMQIAAYDQQVVRQFTDPVYSQYDRPNVESNTKR